MGERILCRHPFNESKRAYVVPQQVEELLKCYWAGKSGENLRKSSIENPFFKHPLIIAKLNSLTFFLEGKAVECLPALKDIRDRCIKQLEKMRPDHMRRLNPTPYKVLSIHINNLIGICFTILIRWV